MFISTALPSRSFGTTEVNACQPGSLAESKISIKYVKLTPRCGLENGKKGKRTLPNFFLFLNPG